MLSAPKTSASSDILNLLVIRIFRVDAPYFCLATPGVQDRIDGTVCSEHGVILVVVTVHTVAPDGIKSRELIQVGPHFSKLGVFAEIRGVRLGHTNQGSFEHIGAIDHPNFLKFPSSTI